MLQEHVTHASRRAGNEDVRERGRRVPGAALSRVHCDVMLINWDGPYRDSMGHRSLFPANREGARGLRRMRAQEQLARADALSLLGSNNYLIVSSLSSLLIYNVFKLQLWYCVYPCST
ncbi:hypothetical protein J6590_018030 [Homalodisca vitripennis]|nr:hypothetical protein J6590_018030 [Homalodisca vitripennis]